MTKAYGTCRCGCGYVGPLDARKLRKSCYSYHHRRNTHIDFPAQSRSRDEVLADWAVCCLKMPEGTTAAEAARKIGIKPRALEKALQRGRSAGDERAFLKLRKPPPPPIPRNWRSAKRARQPECETIRP